jgi:hypothetical protein
MNTELIVIFAICENDSPNAGPRRARPPRGEIKPAPPRSQQLQLGGCQRRQAQPTRTMQPDLSTNWFGRAVARRPKTVMLVTGLTALVLSALGAVLVDHNITAGTEGFEPRGSLLADRQLQNRLLNQLARTPSGRGGRGRRRLRVEQTLNATADSSSPRGYGGELAVARRRQQAATLATMTCTDGNGGDMCNDIIDVIFECVGPGCHIATAKNFHAICHLEDDIRALAGYDTYCARSPTSQRPSECCSPRSLPRIAELLYGVDCATITDEQAKAIFDSVAGCANLRGELADDAQSNACEQLGPFASAAEQTAEWGTTPSGTLSRSAFCLSRSPRDEDLHDGIVLPLMDEVLILLSLCY